MSVTMFFDTPARCTITTADGNELVVDVSAFTISGAMPPSTLELTPPPAAKKKTPAKKDKVYTPADVTDDDAKAVLAGAKDDDIKSRDARAFLIAVLCFMRKRIFKIDAATYTVLDITALNTALSQGVKPSTLAKALMGAGSSEFWRNQGDIMIYQLVKHVGTLSGRHAARRTDPRIALKAMMPRIKENDPIAHAGLVRVLDNMNDEEVAAVHKEWTAKLKVK